MNLKDNYNKINFKDIKFCNYSEILSILEIRNEEKVRINMFNNKIIAIDEHLNWSNEIKNSKFKKFYIIEYYDKIIGGLSLINISETKRSAEWAFYITQKKFFVGLGSLIEYKSLEFFFNNFNLLLLNCYVMKHNQSVLKLHKKFGFEQILNSSNILNDKANNSIYLNLSLDKWDLLKNKFKKKFINNETK